MGLRVMVERTPVRSPTPTATGSWPFTPGVNYFLNLVDAERTWWHFISTRRYRRPSAPWFGVWDGGDLSATPLLQQPLEGQPAS